MPPRIGAEPAPVMRSVVPSSTPGGTSTVTARSSTRRPSPRQCGHGDSTVVAEPPAAMARRARHDLAEDRLAHPPELARAAAVGAA